MQFLKTLLDQIRTALASHTSLILQQLGDLANNIVNMTPSTLVMSVSSPAVATTSDSSFSQSAHKSSSGLKPFVSYRDRKSVEATFSIFKIPEVTSHGVHGLRKKD